MKTNTANPLDPPVSDQEVIRRLTEENRQQSLKIEYPTERIDLLLAQLYGKKSEKRPLELPDQLSYLEDLLKEPMVDPVVAEISVPAHTRKKKGRKPLPEALPRIEVIHDLSEAEKQCSCGSTLTRIGEEVSEQLDYVPAKLQVIRHIRPKYACKTCEGVETDDTTVKIAPPPQAVHRKEYGYRRTVSPDFYRQVCGRDALLSSRKTV